MSDTPRPLTRRVLGLADADRVLRVAEAYAAARGLGVALAVVDEGGHLLLFRRMDEVPWGSGEVALAKAVSAAAYRRATTVFDDRLTGGRLVVLSQPAAFPIQGGVPLRLGGAVVAAIGASGALAAEDTAICEVGAAALEPEPLT